MNKSSGVDRKVVLITGGARGIGFEVGRVFASRGAAVALADINGPGAVESAGHLQKAGHEAMGLAVDVSSPAEVKAMVDRVAGEWGRIDVLVNNAGICPLTPPMDITAEEWDKVLSINLKSTFLCSQAVIPVMRSQHRGKIVNIASSAGQMGGIAVGLHYSASKAGILGLTKSLARFLAPEIQVNAISPGTTDSEMTKSWDETAITNIVRQIPAGRLGRPSDIAHAALFLASEEADFITGQTLSVNGGLLMV